MNVTFHVVGSTAEAVHATALAEIDRFFGGHDTVEWSIACESNQELVATQFDGTGDVIRAGYYCTVNVRERAA